MKGCCEFEVNDLRWQRSGVVLFNLSFRSILSKRLTEIYKEVAMGNIELRNSLEVKLCPFVASQCSRENIRKKRLRLIKERMVNTLSEHLKTYMPVH